MRAIKDGLFIIAVLLGLLAVHGWAVERDLEAGQYQAREALR